MGKKGKKSGGSDNVCVAVRVRPFNDTEIEMGCERVITMNGKETIISEKGGGKKRKFNFDYSFWSFDRENGDYWDNKRVFDAIGMDCIGHAWNGFNISVFAYGQTGSGKSYTMFGYDKDVGIVPIICEKIFEQIAGYTDDGNVKTTFSVDVSMLEIYSEMTRDLLSGGKDVKVREKSKEGKFYCPGLHWESTKSYADIDGAMQAGMSVRTIAATAMNDTSSRAHTIFQIRLQQHIKEFTDDGQLKMENERSALFCLVDLAGSERVSKTGATGATLKQGAAINLSLTCLGTVINVIVDNMKRKKKKHVPFRNSVLTKLLKHALGGNSKTIMVAALSPADRNFDESLSTLRFADRAKQIKTNATVNEDPKDKLIRDMALELEALKKQISAGAFGDLSSGSGGGVNPDEVDKMRANYEAEMMALNEELMRMAESMSARPALQRAPSLDASKRTQYPYLLTITEEKEESGREGYFFDKPVNTISGVKKEGCLFIKGLKILEDHCTMSINETGKVVVAPNCKPNLLFINGRETSSETELKSGDTLILGIKSVYKFFYAGEGLNCQDELTGDEYEDALTESWTREKSLTMDDLTNISSVMKGSGGEGKDMELRVYIKSAQLPEASRAFVRIQLRRYVCCTDWSQEKSTEPTWNQELCGFKVRKLEDNVRIKLLIQSPNGKPTMVDRIEVPLWKIDRHGGELRNKFYMNDKTPLNAILTLTTEGQDSAVDFQ
jgi:kinesin family protein 1